MNNTRKVKEPKISNYSFTDIYDDIKKNDIEIVAKKANVNGWMVQIVPKGSILYRGVPSSDYKHTQYLDNEEGFIYYGNFDVAAQYAFAGDHTAGGAGKIVALDVKQDVTFMDVSEISNFKKLFKMIEPNPQLIKDIKYAYGYDDTHTNPTINRISHPEIDYRLSKWFCSFFNSNNLPFQGYGNDIISGFHTEYIFCTNKITSYIKPSNLEYRWFSFYRQEYLIEKGEFIENKREDYIFETKNGEMTNNVINIKKPFVIFGKRTSDGKVTQNIRRVQFVNGRYYPWPSDSVSFHNNERILFQEPIFSYWLLDVKGLRDRKGNYERLFKAHDEFYPPNQLASKEPSVKKSESAVKIPETVINVVESSKEVSKAKCPKGTRKNKEGQCEKKTSPSVKKSESVVKIPETIINIAEVSKAKCPKGTRKNKEGQCEKKKEKGVKSPKEKGKVTCPEGCIAIQK